MLQQQTDHSIEVLFIQGIHFNQIQEYFLILVDRIDLMAFLDYPCRVYRAQLPYIEKMTALFQLRCRSDETQIKLIELRNAKNNKIKYWLQRQDEKTMEGKYDFSLQIKSEVEIGSQQAKTRNIIKVIIGRNCQPSSELHIFDSLFAMPTGKYIYKKNFCYFKLSREIEYPSSININVSQGQKNKLNKQNDVILCLNQSNLRQLPFFVSAIEKIGEINKIGKIIGHPSSLFLTLLIDQTGKCNQNMEQALLNCTQYKYPDAIPIQVVTRTQIVRGILIRVFSQQNILNPTLTQFIIDNIVGKQFVEDFVKLIQLYYRIFLKENIDKQEIETVIQHYFFNQEQKVQQYSFSFSSLFNFIQWKHNLRVNHLLQLFQIVAKDIEKIKKVEQLTLQDLYIYNNVQFTFIALDLTDKIVRFFNRTTTPNMPIVAILSLIQFLPTPYKSIYWREQWGRYRIHNDQTVRQINIAQHQIVDSRFLLQTPLDLIEDESLRKSYMKIGQNQIIHAISSARKKATELPQMEQLKTLLKGMKSKAIDAIPKIRLIWKLVTTQNRIELDLNNFETFQQIPIISRFVSLDESFKVYLDNINKEANRNFTIISVVPFLSPTVIQIDKISANLSSIQKLLNEFVQTTNLHQCSLQQFYVQLDIIERNFNQHCIQSYDDYLYLTSKIQGLIKAYPIKAKYKYRMQMNVLIQKMSKHRLTVNSQETNALIKNIIANLKQAELKLKNERQNDVNTPSFLRDTNSLISLVEKIAQKMIQLIRQFKKDVRRFNEVCRERQLQCIMVKYDKLLYRLCNDLHNALFRVSDNKRVYKFYSELYNYTPYLYLLQRFQADQILLIERIKTIIPTDISKIHLLLNGQSNTLLPLANQLICLKNKFKTIKITNITSTNFHSIAAVLFALNLDDETFVEELVGLQRLVKTIKIEDQNIDLLQMLLRPYQRYDEFEEEANEQLYLKVAKKYQTAFKLLIQLQQTSKITKRLNIHKLYELINQYDKEQQQKSTEFKQQQIMTFLQGLLTLQKDYLRKNRLINQSKGMIQQKMKLNKVGIKFMIRFLYRYPQREVNWLSIHLHKHKCLRLLQQHLKQLFSKYSLSLQITLQQFNKSNGMEIQLSFVLINYYRNRYEIFDSTQKGYVRLLDLLVASVSSPLDFPARMISIRQMDATQKIEAIMKKSQNQFTESFKDEAYWSSFGCNTIPFNLISKKSKGTFYCTLQFVDETIFNLHNLNRSSLGYRQSPKQANQQKNNLRAVDLLSMWWTKSKKLNPEMKEILFGSIFESPFLYYYYILQNSSYEALINNRDKRYLMNLNEEEINLIAKGYIIGNFFNKNQKDTAILRLRRINQYLQIELIAIRSNLQIKVQNLANYLKEGQEYLLQNCQTLSFHVYRFKEIKLQHIQINFTLNQPLNNTKYYHLNLDNEVIISELAFSYKSINLLPVKSTSKKTIYKIKLYNRFEKKQYDKYEGSTSSKCFKGQQRLKRGNLNMYLLARESPKSDFKQFKQRFIEEVRNSVIIEKKKAKKKGFLCFSCCFKPTIQDQ